MNIRRNEKKLRTDLMKYANVLSEVKPVHKVPLLDVISIGMAADYLELPEESIRKYCLNHSGELQEYGFVNLKDCDFENAGYTVKQDRIIAIVQYGDYAGRIARRGTRFLSEAALFNIALGISGSAVADTIRQRAMYLHRAETNSDIQELENESPYMPQENTEEDNKLGNADIRSFTNGDLGSVRVVMIDDAPWFVGKDVAEMLGYAKPLNAIETHVEQDDSLKQGLTDALGRIQNTTLINESGLYSLVLSSKLPTAKQFKRWVTNEVLPSVRKHGAYMTAETITKSLQDPKNLIALLETLKAEQEKTAALTQANCELATANKAMAKELSTWEKNSILTALIRMYAQFRYKSQYGIAYDKFYKELAYKCHINLKSRQSRDNKKMATIKYLRGNEIDDAIALAAAMCENAGINVGSVINSVNAKIIAG